MENDRKGAQQPERFDPKRAITLDDPARFEYLPPGEIFALLEAPQNATVIDLGTGTGTYALKLAQARPDLLVIALDEQSEMLDLLRRKLEQAPVANLRPVLADGQGLAGLKGSADGLLALNVLHELGDAALRQAAGMLKPGGRALFVDWNAAVDRPVGPPREHVLSAEDGQRRLNASGLAVLSRKVLRYHYALLCRKAA